MKSTIHYWIIPGVKRKTRELFIWEIVAEVAAWESVDIDMVKTGRGARWVHARYVVIYLMGKYGKMGERKMADYFGYKDRLSVVYGKRWVKKRLAWDGEVRDMVEWVETRLMGWEKRDVSFKSRRAG